MDNLIGFFLRCDTAQRFMQPFGIVVGKPFTKCTPDPQGILIEFFIHRAMHPFHFAVPVRRLLRYEEVRNMFRLAPDMKVTSKLTAVVCLDGTNRKSEVDRRPLNHESGVFAFASRENLRVALFREWVENGELILSSSFGIHIFHIELNALARLSDD